MISGLNSTGHEIGGTIGIAIFSTIAAGAGVLAGPQAASGNRPRVRRGRAPRRCRQPGRARRPPEVTPLPAEAAAEPQRDADPLIRTEPRKSRATQQKGNEMAAALARTWTNAWVTIIDGLPAVAVLVGLVLNAALG